VLLLSLSALLSCSYSNSNCSVRHVAGSQVSRVHSPQYLNCVTILKIAALTFDKSGAYEGVGSSQGTIVEEQCSVAGRSR
jgi:hypothetical protein